MRMAILILMLLPAGCARDHSLQVKTGFYKAPRLESELNFYVANFSSHETNHFYVGATKISKSELVSAWIYWKEERTLLPYAELVCDAPKGTEILAWGVNQLKLDRDTVDTPEDIGGSTYLETHRQWIDWMEQCILKGQPFCVLKTNA